MNKQVIPFKTKAEQGKFYLLDNKLYTYSNIKNKTINECWRVVVNNWSKSKDKFIALEGQENIIEL